MRPLSYILFYVYWYVLSLAAVYAVYCFRKVDRPTRYLCLWLWLGMLTEAVSLYWISRFKTNWPVYSASSIVEFVLICLYLNNNLHYYQERKIGLIAAGIGLPAGIVNMLWLQPVQSLNSNFQLFECLVLVCLILYTIYRRLLIPDLYLSRETHFWIPCIFLFYLCGTILNSSIYEQVRVGQAYLLTVCNNVINIITYLSCAIILIAYPKMSRTHA